jgi:hypothetical protein
VYSALDADRDGVVDLAGLDRVSRSLTDAFYHSGMGQNVWRTRTWAWEADNSGVSNLVGLVERSADGLQSWNTLTNGGSAVATKVWATVAASGSRQSTNFLANGATLLSQYTDGRLISVTSRDSAGSQTGKTTYGYDAYGRWWGAERGHHRSMPQNAPHAGRNARTDGPTAWKVAGDWERLRSHRDRGRAGAAAGGVASLNSRLTAAIPAGRGTRMGSRFVLPMFNRTRVAADPDNCLAERGVDHEIL